MDQDREEYLVLAETCDIIWQNASHECPRGSRIWLTPFEAAFPLRAGHIEKM